MQVVRLGQPEIGGGDRRRWSEEGRKQEEKTVDIGGENGRSENLQRFGNESLAKITRLITFEPLPSP